MTNGTSVRSADVLAALHGLRVLCPLVRRRIA
jgi:hypothetical protein